jgi:hypothetical protein
MYKALVLCFNFRLSLPVDSFAILTLTSGSHSFAADPKGFATFSQEIIDCIFIMPTSKFV